MAPAALVVIISGIVRSRLGSLLFLIAFFPLVALADPGSSSDQSAASVPDTGFGPGTSPRYGLAVAELLGSQVAVNVFDRYVSDEYWADVNLQAWESNIEGPWVYDRDPWPVNELGHPLQGAIYFSAARSNGMNFWESSLASGVGGALWELFGETHTPDTNDFITTALGGSVVGEIFHRLYAVAAASDSSWRFFVPSLDAVNDELYDCNPAFDADEGRLPLHCSVATGFSYVDASLSSARNIPSDAGTGGPSCFATESLVYGRPFGTIHAPFDYFTQSFTVVTAPPDYGLVWFSSGDLASWPLVDETKAKLVAVTNLDYDFIYGDLFEFSTNSFGTGLRGELEEPGGWRLSGELHLNFLALATTESVYLREDPAITEGSPNAGRDYDFGYGAGTKIRLAVSQRRAGRLSVDYALYDIQEVPCAVLSEAAFDYAFLGVLNVSYEHRIFRHMTLGLDYTLYHKYAVYEDLASVYEYVEAFSLVVKMQS